MKFSAILAVVTACIGFAVGWVAKPSTAASAGGAANSAQPPPRVRPPAHRDTPPDAPVRPDFADETLPRLGNPADLTARRNAAQSMDSAKLMRLAEALQLTSDQESQLEKAISDSTSAITEDQFIKGLAQRGDYILSALKTLLSPEQHAAFIKLMERSQDNTIEASTQRQLADLIEQIDLTPQQREAIAEQIRQQLRQDSSQLPPSLAILSDTSPLPLGGSQLPVESLRASQLSPDGAPTDPKAPELTSQQLESILTPAQAAQFDVIEAKKQRLLETLRRMPR